ncbi:acetate--CoA ligase family protein [Thermococcus thioreducens]|uniref:acetate--CoA ligase (ADP-forming) n=1 Tax=Thermococcus thioreducens TaxID=277988 RepID=A0A1I0P0S8_9EURY|nr:CoA-binding protein [Thermococcus thioreducens]ASJ11375.1 acyl-CoA synthetase [Thermococcus thioreducens]SEW07755.1 acetyl coenzyme A synthetase (ADP forming), alpha domain-containing protein [Thermococcus thioreducens]
MDFFFYPSSVAVFGSFKKGAIAYEILRNIVEGGFGGKIIPVNPKGGTVEVAGRTFEIRGRLDEPVDSAIIAIPAKFVPTLIDEIGPLIKGAVVISAGFSEVGNEELERELVEKARRHGVRIIGPNCAGIFGVHGRFFGSFEVRVRPGGLALISQSGAFGGAALAMGNDEGIGFSAFVSYGNASDLNESDFLEYFADDENTRAIALYIEGVKDGRRFLKALRYASARKPVIILKAGKSASGAKAAASHTGSLAGSYEIYRAAFKQAGAIEVEEMEELFDAAKAFEMHTRAGKRVAVITNSGGPGVLATDKLERLGLEIAELGDETVDELRSFLPSQCSVRNPIDLIADADYERYRKTIEVVCRDQNVDSLLVICVPPIFLPSEEIAKAVIEADCDKPIVVNFMAGELVSGGVKLLENHGIKNFPTPERAARALHWLSLR